MAKTYRALVGFHCPADPESLKKVKAALKMEHGPARDELMDKVRWMSAKEGDKVVPYNEAILKSWLDNEAVEEVTANG